MKNKEFYRHNDQYPKTFYDFLNMAKPIRKEELELADKDALIELSVCLKRKELENYIKANRGQTLIEKCYDFISRGANTFTNAQRIELENELSTYLGILE